MASHTPSDKKSDPAETTPDHNSDGYGKGEIAYIDAAETTLESFSHLDEKKILRKVCWRCRSSRSLFCLALVLTSSPRWIFD